MKEALRGTWATEHVFALGQALRSWEHYQALMAECDQEIERLLQGMGDDAEPPTMVGTGKKPSVNAPNISDLSGLVARLCGGHDLRRWTAHTEYSVLQVISEVGTDLTK